MHHSFFRLDVRELLLCSLGFHLLILPAKKMTQRRRVGRAAGNLVHGDRWMVTPRVKVCDILCYIAVDMKHKHFKSNCRKVVLDLGKLELGHESN